MAAGAAGGADGHGARAGRADAAGAARRRSSSTRRRRSTILRELERSLLRAQLTQREAELWLTAFKHLERAKSRGAPHTVATRSRERERPRRGPQRTGRLGRRASAFL